MKKILLLSLIFISITGFTQDWAPFKMTDTIRHFIVLGSPNSNNNHFRPIQSVSVDSAFSDSLGYVLQLEKGFSVLRLFSGDKIKGRIFGDNMRFYQDSLVVSTVDSLGFQLNFPLYYAVGKLFNFGTSVNYTISGTCDSIYLDSVGNGQIDSVAKISLTVFDHNQNAANSHPFNCEYVISKNYGLLLTPDFTSLDSLHYYEPYFKLKEQLRCDRAFDLNVGDEYHYTHDTNNYVTFNGRNIFYSHYGYKVQVTGDTTIGTSKTITITEQSGSGYPGQYGAMTSKISSFSHDTTGYCHIPKSAIIPDYLLDFSQSSNSVPLTIYGVDDTKPLFKLIKTREFSNQIIDYNFQGWPPVIDSIRYSSFYSSIYTTYIGLTDTYFANGFGGNGSSSVSKRLVYFKKGNQTWGTPLNLAVGMEEINQTGALKLYPNPVSNQLQIETKEPLRFILISDINGKTVEVNVNNNIVDVSNLSSGLYFIQVETEEGIFKDKFIKE